MDDETANAPVTHAFLLSINVLIGGILGVLLWGRCFSLELFDVLANNAGAAAQISDDACFGHS